MSRATELASVERRAATRRSRDCSGGVYNYRCIEKRSPGGRCGREKRRVDQTVEKLLLKLAHRAFRLMRVARVRRK
jgi:hypothetical protein